ncbi:glycerophosphoryl diester phosphodiesterase [Weizmannia acidilactici]|uniref:Glycerophosphoryl diester phosphodiesterase n=1 Tax=Weizmannia acidilactici TaxID=2607726 RepID=A0A5J4JBV5_9BACI|nr:glycerophosphodiester phosphodiesterase [Weizmannia acidilactici]GER66123.1 glycerophosphoryl diester phosphodiesterase [Weizmannia acidilactici]GER69241.1 glycerophosphoryl diester phosphodiesterase [Weizmannia acidilactici]GER72433.1 glycerophosphoryl diester phosphodiesterase [Weizmannia acidilactici]
MTFIFAHRGSAGTHPENTMEAFLQAERAGADGIELDVQLSKDGEIVVIHDETVNRTTSGKGFVKDFTLAELQNLDVRDRFGVAGKLRIPALKEVFGWLKTNRLLCNIELKTAKISYPSIEEKTVALIKAYQLEERVIFSSFNHYSIIHCYRLAPEIEIAPLYSEMLFMPWVYAKSIRAGGIHPRLVTTSDQIIQTAMENGIAVRPYTVNTEKDMRRLFEIGCTAIITDYPEMAERIRKEYE